MKTAPNRPISRSQTLFRIRCPGIPASQAFPERVNPMLMGYAHVLEWMRRGDTLAARWLDRPWRSLRQLAATVRELEERRFGFRSFTEPIDNIMTGGTLVLHVFGALEQFERDLIREPSRQAEAMLRDREGYPLVSEEIRGLSIGCTTFYHRFPK